LTTSFTLQNCNWIESKTEDHGDYLKTLKSVGQKIVMEKVVLIQSEGAVRAGEQPAQGFPHS